MPFEKEPRRRDFLKSVGTAGLVSAVPASEAAAEQNSRAAAARRDTRLSADISYPRTFTGAALKMISSPLGGIGTGSIGLGGRGQLRDWEIFNQS